MHHIIKWTMVCILLVCSHVTFSQLFRPYKCGPVLKKDNIQVFDSLNQFLDIKPGSTFAEIGASSGYYNGAMGVFLNDVTIYIQDIDETCLNEKNLKKVLSYYSRFSDVPIEEKNSFHVRIGTDYKTNLPENSVDVAFANATFHVLEHPDSIVADLHRSLKANGTLSIRDEFVEDDVVKLCPYKKCGKPITEFNEFQAIMNRNGFEMIDSSNQFGHKIYKFVKKD